MVYIHIWQCFDIIWIVQVLGYSENYKINLKKKKTKNIVNVNWMIYGRSYISIFLCKLDTKSRDLKTFDPPPNWNEAFWQGRPSIP